MTYDYPCHDKLKPFNSIDEFLFRKNYYNLQTKQWMSSKVNTIKHVHSKIKNELSSDVQDYFLIFAKFTILPRTNKFETRNTMKNMIHINYLKFGKNW